MSFVALNLPSTRYSWNRSKWPPGAFERCKFGQRVLWRSISDTDSNSSGGGRHLDPHVLEPYRTMGDEPVDQILERMEKHDGVPLGPGDDFVMLAKACFHLRQQTGSDQEDTTRATTPTAATSDDYAKKTSRFSAETRKALADFYAYYYRLPPWADLDDIVEGRRVFLSYLPAFGASLFYRSLVPGFSIPKITAVLSATGYLAPPSTAERVSERLVDTGAFLAMCSRGGSDSLHLSDLLGGGPGWTAALQVRVLHAKVRRSLLRRRRSRLESARVWNVDKWGVPINQEDMTATLLGFSTNALLGCEIILGFSLPLKERLAYMVFWRYVGWLLGVPTVDEEGIQPGNDDNKGQKLRPLDPCGPGWILSRPDVTEHSYAVFQSIIFHLLHPDETSATLAHHLLRVGRRRQDSEENTALSQVFSNETWFYFRCLQCRRFVGHPLADALRLPYHPTWYYRLFLWTASTVYLLVLRVYTMAALPMSPFRRRILAFHQRRTLSFADKWRQAHLDRMKERLKEVVLVDARTTKNENASEVAEISACPFSMITFRQ